MRNCVKCRVPHRVAPGEEFAEIARMMRGTEFAAAGLAISRPTTVTPMAEFGPCEAIEHTPRMQVAWSGARDFDAGRRPVISGRASLVIDRNYALASLAPSRSVECPPDPGSCSERGVPDGEWFVDPVPCLERQPALGVSLWPGGVVPYAFDPWMQRVPGDYARNVVREGLARWMDAMDGVIEFVEFEPPAPGRAIDREVMHYVQVTLHPGPGSSADIGAQIGRDAGEGPQYARFSIRVLLPEVVSAFPRDQAIGSVVHEFGHAIGLRHEHKRPDRDRWLRSIPTAVVRTFGRANVERQAVPPLPPGVVWPFPDNVLLGAQSSINLTIPVLQDYAYGSIMNYAGVATESLAIPGGGTMVTSYAIVAPTGNQVSVGSPDNHPSVNDLSQVAQLYYRERRPSWGLFQTLDSFPDDPLALPSPMLDLAAESPAVFPRSSPAVVLHPERGPCVLVRGSDNLLYLSYVVSVDGVARVVRWVPVADADDVGSDPAATASGDDSMDVLYVRASNGRLRHVRFAGEDVVEVSDVPDTGDQRGPRGLPEIQRGVGDPKFGNPYLGPGLVAVARGELLAFCTSGRDLYTAVFDGRGWGAWKAMGVRVEARTKPSVSAARDGAIVLGYGANNLSALVATVDRRGRAANWVNIGRDLTSGPAVLAGDQG